LWTTTVEISAAWFSRAGAHEATPRASDLVVSQLANELQRQVAALTARPGFERHYWLQTQLRRSTSAACSAIAEGFQRSNPHDFARFIRNARMLIDDSRNQIVKAKGLGLVPAGEADRLRILADRASAAASSLMRYLQAC
jgi:four helix bundle protein